MADFSWPLIGTPAISDAWQKGRYAYTVDGYLRYVLAVIENTDGSYTMLKSRKHNGRFQCPGGKVDFGETGPEALEREIAEELGCHISIESLLGTRKVYAGGTLWQGEYYRAQLKQSPRIMEPHKHDGLWRVTLTNSSAISSGFSISATQELPQSSTYNVQISDSSILDETYDALALNLWQRTGNLQQTDFRLYHHQATKPDLATLKKVYYLKLEDGQRALATQPSALPHNAHILSDFPGTNLQGVRL